MSVWEIEYSSSFNTSLYKNTFYYSEKSIEKVHCRVKIVRWFWYLTRKGLFVDCVQCPLESHWNDWWRNKSDPKQKSGTSTKLPENLLDVIEIRSQIDGEIPNYWNTSKEITFDMNIRIKERTE